MLRKNAGIVAAAIACLLLLVGLFALLRPGPRPLQEGVIWRVVQSAQPGGATGGSGKAQPGRLSGV